jgi:hypothetical protein
MAAGMGWAALLGAVPTRFERRLSGYDGTTAYRLAA